MLSLYMHTHTLYYLCWNSPEEVLPEGLSEFHFVYFPLNVPQYGGFPS
jgi:hypothetical protein